jgi:hypothetical protein
MMAPIFFASQTGVRKVARRENPETRNPNAERNQKPELPKATCQSWIRFSEFGLLSDSEFQISDLTLRFLFSILAP